MSTELFLVFCGSVIPVPGITTTSVIRIGYLFGPQAFPHVFCASMFGAGLAFYIGRRISLPTRLSGITTRAIRNDAYMLTALRLSPTPTCIVSYSLGSLSHISWRKYALATAIGYQKLWLDLLIGYNMSLMMETSSSIKICGIFIGLGALCMTFRQIQTSLSAPIDA